MSRNAMVHGEATQSIAFKNHNWTIVMRTSTPKPGSPPLTKVVSWRAWTALPIQGDRGPGHTWHQAPPLAASSLASRPSSRSDQRREGEGSSTAEHMIAAPLPYPFSCDIVECDYTI
jgi:hypothetical protein